MAPPAPQLLGVKSHSAPSPQSREEVHMPVLGHAPVVATFTPAWAASHALP